jgi:phosphatidylinositol kinase/protein kinase (PI-3  family)
MSLYLSNMAGTAIPMPGQEFAAAGGAAVVTIHKMNRMAYVLPTKTRPKKIGFKGSDGKEYVFAHQCR